MIRQDWDFRSRRRRSQTLLSLLSTAVSSGAYLYAVLHAAGNISLGDLTLYAGAVSQTQGTLQTLLGGISSIYETNLQVDDLLTFLDFQPAVVSGPRRLAVRARCATVEFRDVSFTYPPSSARRPGHPPAPSRFPSETTERRPWSARGVLTGVSFTIPAGKTVALVGANRAGKTTLVKLLSRLYDPTAGAILLDGTDRELDLEDLRGQVAVVFQDYARFQLPARDNIGFGQVQQLADTERIARAAQRGAVQVIERLPSSTRPPGAHVLRGRGALRRAVAWALARGFMRDAPSCWCWTSPPPPWTPRPSTRSTSASASSPPGGRPCSSPTASPPCAWPTTSSSWRAVASPSRAATTPCSPAAGSYARLYELRPGALLPTIPPARRRRRGGRPASLLRTEAHRPGRGST